MEFKTSPAASRMPERSENMWGGANAYFALPSGSNFRNTFALNGLLRMKKQSSSLG
jgi:hypothetical protein